jgi:hypothetical protein
MMALVLLQLKEALGDVNVELLLVLFLVMVVVLVESSLGSALHLLLLLIE